MQLTVLFWNIWLDNQVRGEEGAAYLLAELQRIVTEYQPDVIGLTEVLQLQATEKAFVLAFLQEHGYAHTYYAAASPLDKAWTIGTALCSRHPFEQVGDVAISRYAPFRSGNFPGANVRAITASLALPGKRPCNIIVAHPMYLRQHTLRDHYEGTRKLEALVRSEQYTANTILGGDFNEPGFLPKAFRTRVANLMEFRSGGRLHTTWRHNGWRLTPIRANLDHIYWSKQSDFVLVETKVIATHVSDHRPILARFYYPPSS